MAWWNFLADNAADKGAHEVRGTSPAQEERTTTVTQSREDFFAALGVNWNTAATDVVVNRDTALGVPAVLAAVEFLSGTLAGLPVGLFRKGKAGREKQSGALADLLRYAVNPETSSFEWRKRLFNAVLTEGRGLSYIERTDTGAIFEVLEVTHSIYLVIAT